ncbi:MAG: ABC transporter substrate-binding protein [Propionibacteriaceae bacterium]
MRARTTVRTTGVLAAGVLLLAACGGGGGDDGGSGGGGEPQPGGDLVMVRADDPSTLMPTEPSDNASIWVIQNVYDTLVVASDDGQEIEPGLAEEWEQSEDKLTWTFQLREGVTFHNGDPLTADDVKFSIDRATDPEMPFGSLNEQIESVEAPDETTVVVTTKVPWAPLPADLALFANSIVPTDFAGLSEEEFAEKPIGSGPFKFDSWTRGQSLKVVKNADYWEEGKPYLDSVTFNTVPDANTRAQQVVGDQAQINEFPPYSTIEGLRTTPNVQVETFDSSKINYINVNHREAPLNDVHVRRALSMALDRESMIDAVTYGNAQQATTFMSPALWGHDPEIEGLQFDVEAAKAELAKSEHSGGDLSIEMTISSGDPDDSAIAQIAQEAFAQIGVELTINPLDPATARENRANGNFELITAYATTDITDPDQMVGFLVRGGNRINSGYANDELDAAASKAAQTEDRAEREELYSQIQQIATDEVAVIPLYYSPAVFSFSDSVKGFKTTAVGSYTLRDTWLDD